MSSSKDADKYLEKYRGTKDDAIQTGDQEITTGDLTQGSGTDNQVSIVDKGLFAKGENKLFKNSEERMIQNKRKELSELQLGTQLDKLREQCKAAVRESRAFWDGKSSEIAQQINAFVSASIQNIEVERTGHLNKVIDDITRNANQHVKEAVESDLLEAIKEKRIDIIMEEMVAAMKRVREEHNNRR